MLATGVVPLTMRLATLISTSGDRASALTSLSIIVSGIKARTYFPVVWDQLKKADYSLELRPNILEMPETPAKWREFMGRTESLIPEFQSIPPDP